MDVNMILKSLEKEDLRNSDLLNCIIDDEEIPMKYMKKYKRVLKYIYYIIDRKTIFSNTILNITEEPKYKYNKGYIYYKKLGFSIENRDSKILLKEMVTMLSIKNHKFRFMIILKSGDILEISTL